MAELLPQLAGAGGIGVLAIVITYLLGSNRADRRAAVELVDAANRRANDADARARALQVELDDALRARRIAENEAAQLARQLVRDDPDPMRTTLGGVP